MENIFLAIALIIALLLVGAVLLQQSEGGALGMGGGGGGVMSGRGAATALQKATWGLVIAFIAVCIVLTIFATQRSKSEGLAGSADAASPAAVESAEQPAGDEVDLAAPGITPPSAEAGAETPADKPLGLDDLRAPGLTDN